MRFSTSKNELHEALQKLSKATPLRSTLPVLSCVLVSATNNNTTLTATDLELTIHVRLSVSIEEEGSAAIPLKQLYDITNEFPDGTRISISANSRNKIEINTLSGSYDLMGKQKEEFPATPKVNENRKVKILGSVLKEMINSSLFAVSKDDLKPSLTGVLLRFSSVGLTAVATDGHRLVKIINDKYKTDMFNGDIVVPKKFLSYLSNHLGNEEVALSIGETHLTATIDHDTIISRTISEVFPDYESVIPTDNNNKLTVDKKTLLGAIKRVSIFSNKSTHQVALDISKGQLFITTEDPESSSKAKEEVIAEYEGEDLTIGYNGEYLKDVINHTDGDKVVLKLNTPISATLFVGAKKEKDKIMLLMPVRINI